MKSSTNIGYTLLSYVAPILAAILLTPTLIKNLGIDVFGIFSLTLTFIGSASVLDFGVGRGLIISVADARASGRTKDVPCILGSSVTIMAVVGVLACFTFAIAGERYFVAINDISLDHNQVKWVVVGIAAAVGITFPSTICRSYLEVHQNFVSVALSRAVYGVMCFAVPAGMAINGFGSVAALSSLSIIRIIYSLVLLNQAFTYSRLNYVGSWSPRKEVGLAVIRASGFIFVLNMLSFFFGTIDRFLVGRWMGLTATAIYSTPLDIISRASVLPGAIVTVIFPRLAFGLGQYGGGVRKVDLLYSQSFLANLIISGLGLFCASLLAPLLLSVWLGNAYSPIMTDIARIGCVGFFANFTAYISTAYLNASGRSVVIVKIQLFEIAVLFLILAIFKSDCGVVGLCFVFSARLLADSIFLMIASISVRVASVGFSYVMCVEASLFSLFVILIGSTVFIAI